MKQIVRDTSGIIRSEMDVSRGRITLLSVNINSTGDNIISGLPAKWKPISLIVTDASTSLALLATVADLRTSSGGGGSSLISGLVFTGLTVASKLVDATLLAVTDYYTQSSIYFRITVGAGSAATVRVIFQFEDLS